MGGGLGGTGVVASAFWEGVWGGSLGRMGNPKAEGGAPYGADPPRHGVGRQSTQEDLQPVLAKLLVDYSIQSSLTV